MNIFTHEHYKKQPENVCPQGLSPQRRMNLLLRLVRGAGCCGLVVAAVHLLLHGTVLLQLLAGVVGDLQEAAGLHHHVGLAGVRQDGVLRDDLHVSQSGFIQFSGAVYINMMLETKNLTSMTSRSSLLL